jgi:hypothetical protein
MVLTLLEETQLSALIVLLTVPLATVQDVVNVRLTLVSTTTLVFLATFNLAHFVLLPMFVKIAQETSLLPLIQPPMYQAAAATLLSLHPAMDHLVHAQPAGTSPTTHAHAQ